MIVFSSVLRVLQFTEELSESPSIQRIISFLIFYAKEAKTIFSNNPLYSKLQFTL